MNQQVKNWLDSAAYDLETTEHMYRTGRYVHTIFMCHLAIEKVLKARVQEVTGQLPPKTHNLRYLVQLSRLEIPEGMFEFLSMLSDVSIPTRYPEDFGKLVEAYNGPVARRYADKTREVFQWIRESLTP
ncbi:MAG TPA: HEPN domain-containing protein [Planctomycetota bacterium]|nr:HEPN domain-containing protein [Planctomycetota bacterium]